MTDLPWCHGKGSPTAFIGVAKHAGKTTALGRWTAERVDRDATVGLLSIGVDGESRDAVLGTAKPDIAIPRGHFVAAGSEALERSSARFEYVAGLGCSTAFGRAYVARTLDPGTVVLGGLRHRDDVRRAIATIEDVAGGACEVFVDGAYGRTVSADGRVARSIVVATGPVAGDSPAAVVRATAPLVDKLRLERPVGELARTAEQAERESRALFATPDGPVRLPHASALRGLPAAAGDWPDAACGVAIPGAVTDGVLEELLRARPSGATLVAMAPASLQAGREAWSGFRESDWRVHVRHPVRLRAIAINPTGPTGQRLEAEALRRAVERRWPGMPVVDARRKTCNLEANVEG